MFSDYSTALIPDTHYKSMHFDTMRRLQHWLTVALFAAFPVALGLANVLMLLLLFVWLASGDYARLGKNLLRSPVALSLAGIYLVLVVGCFYGTAPSSDMANHLSRYSRLAFASLLLASLMGEPLLQKRCMKAFAFAMLFIMLSVWANVWVRLPWSETQTPGWGLSHHVIGDYITQNIMMAFFYLLLIIKAWRVGLQKNQIPQALAWLVLAILACISVTHLSLGRTGYVLIGLATAIAAFGLLKGRVLVYGLLIGFALAMIVGLSSPVLQKRFLLAWHEVTFYKDNMDSSLGNRMFLYTELMPKLIEQKPWFGHGTGGYPSAVCTAVAPRPCTPPLYVHPENQFLAFTANSGVVGFLVYLSLFASMIYTALGCNQRSTRVAFLGLCFFLMAASMIDSTLYRSRSGHFFVLMLALLASITHSQYANKLQGMRLSHFFLRRGNTA
jgi:O-antigen ligase